ncbi:MAG: molybdopterin-dependent oxidoreductase [Chloroflexi bacterium]|nr:molybdopterin-dependent oxidoreductase [Chloroflexota bacterium]
MSAQPKRKWRMSRRGFLIGTGVLGAGLALGYTIGLPKARLQMAAMFDSGVVRLASLAIEPTQWIEITPANKVIFHLSKIEMGQGVHTALAQVLAEELEADWGNIEVRHADTARGPVDAMGTTGSTTVSSNYASLREIAATMREMLRAEAAKLLNVPAAGLIAQNSMFVAGANKISYGEVVKAHSGKWELPKDKPTLKPVSEFKLIGTSAQRVDLPAKIVGNTVYGLDARLPGMLYGAVATPPTLGATFRRASIGDAGDQPGVRKVLIESNFAGVVAESRQQAQAAVNALSVVWDELKPWQQSDVDALLEIRERDLVAIQQEGTGALRPNTPPTSGGETRGVIEARYSSPFAAHGQLEPQAALADVQPDKARVWVSTQMPALARSEIAKALGMKDEQVEIMPTFIGGGFGRKYGADVAIPAAKLSRAMGKPVHIGWTRSEEFQHGYLRPPTRHILRGALTADGRIDGLTHLQSSGEVAGAFLPAALISAMGSDFGAWRGGRIHYEIANRYVGVQFAKLPVRTSWWRGLGLLANTFAIESFIDELAHAAKADPLAFRLKHLGNNERGERFRKVLNAVAAKANWGSPAPAGRARGLACCIDGNAVVAQVAEVSVEGTGAAKKIRVHRFFSAIDAGLVINPDGVKAQTEGAIVMGISSALIEQVTLKDGRVNANNFDAYPLLTMRDTPTIETVIVPSGDQPFGVGEPPLGPVAAAIANAVFSLTGQRLRNLPLAL